jgi:hypothetical protein
MVNEVAKACEYRFPVLTRLRDELITKVPDLQGGRDYPTRCSGPRSYHHAHRPSRRYRRPNEHRANYLRHFNERLAIAQKGRQ